MRVGRFTLSPDPHFARRTNRHIYANQNTSHRYHTSGACTSYHSVLATPYTNRQETSACLSAARALASRPSIVDWASPPTAHWPHLRWPCAPFSHSACRTTLEVCHTLDRVRQPRGQGPGGPTHVTPGGSGLSHGRATAALPAACGQLSSHQSSHAIGGVRLTDAPRLSASLCMSPSPYLSTGVSAASHRGHACC